MQQRQHIEEVHSLGGTGPHQQHLLSLSASRVSNIQRLDSHIKSTLPHLQGKQDKKYVFVKIHNSFHDLKEQNCLRLTELLQEQFEGRVDIQYFKETRELLSQSYDDDELHYIVVPEKHLSWAETFARQEREDSGNKKKIYVYGLLKRSTFNEKMKARSKKRIEKIPDYIEYYSQDDNDYPATITQTIEEHLALRIRQQGNHVKTWALTNKFSGKQVKKRTLHFYYDARMEAELTGLYRTYKKKSKSSWIQMYHYSLFEDVLRKIREREVAGSKEQDMARKMTSKLMTSKLMKSTSELGSMRSGLDGVSSQLNSSMLGSSIRAINKLDKNDVNIIICLQQHPEIEKFRALVRAQKHSNWTLWEIKEGNSQFLTQLRDFLNQQARSQEQFEAEEYQRIIHSKTLYILAQNTDFNTIEMYQNQRNVLHNMELLQYSDSEQFALLLRQGVNSSQDFVIAVVPGGYRSFATDYARVIAQFDAKYKNVDCVENYKFISNANGMHVSNIMTSNLLGTNSNLTNFEDNKYLENIMKERDKYFHPFEGLKGRNVFLLIKETIQDQLDDLRDFIASSGRLQISTYIDRQFLKRQVETIILKDSVLIVTDGSTLRQAQSVARNFDEVSILNISDKQGKEEIKVIASGPKEVIYDLIRNQIPQLDQQLGSQIYEEPTDDSSYTRKNRILPKTITYRPGDTVTVRLPAKVEDEQSRKMEVRLMKYFNQEIKIKYYKQPRDIRLLNKQEEPLAFVVWAEYDGPSADRKKENEKELVYFQDLARNEQDQLRQEFIIYSKNPKKYQQLTTMPDYQRFKFVSSRWERIEEYIIGIYQRLRQPDQHHDTIRSDEMMRVFFNDQDKASRDMINVVSKRRDNNELNAANHIQFHLIDDLESTLAQQAPYHKYYVVLNENTIADNAKNKVYEVMNRQEYRDRYIKVIQVGSGVVEKGDERVRRRVNSQAEAGDWLCGTRVLPAEVHSVIPHVVIDRNNLEWFYFLDKYSRLTRRFTYAYCPNKEDVKAEINSRQGDTIWIIVKDNKALNDQVRSFEKLGNFKNVKFICQYSDQVPAGNRHNVGFKNQDKRQIEKFLLNLYRRDKHMFFPSSVSSKQVVLGILKGEGGRPIPINKQELANWQNILKAKVIQPADMTQLREAAWAKDSIVYVVYPHSAEKDVMELCREFSHFRRISMQAPPHYDHRRLDRNYVQNNTDIYIGTYPAEITEYLRYLRYNIRRPEQQLAKMKQQLIEVNFQKDYELSQEEVKRLTEKNHSIIVDRNGYEMRELNDHMARSNRYGYLQIYVGDQQTGKAVSQYNVTKNKDIRFIDAKASPLIYMKGDSKNSGWLLESNERDQLHTYLYNLPQNRYMKATNNRGRFLIYANPRDQNIAPYLSELEKVRERNPKIEVRYYNYVGDLEGNKDPGVVMVHSSNEKEYLDNGRIGNNINLLSVSERYRPDKNYAGYGKKYFLTKESTEFYHFMNQVVTQNTINLQPIPLALDSSNNLVNSLHIYNSQPLPQNMLNLTTMPPFAPKPLIDDIVPAPLAPGVIDQHPPSLAQVGFPKADEPSLPLGIDWIARIKQHMIRNKTSILEPGLDNPPSRNWFDIRSEPDRSIGQSLPIPLPGPITKVSKSKLAILHPAIPEFDQIAEMLIRNLEPDQYIVTRISFRSEHELDSYSKNNLQRLEAYDKIVVFLSNKYRKYDPTLQAMKAKMTPRMEYFIFDDNFHEQNHGILRRHLRPYRIKPYGLPYTADYVPKNLANSRQVVVLTPPQLLSKYLPLQAGHVLVKSYTQDSDITPHLHRQGVFVIIVVGKEDYHRQKFNAKISPRCMLVVDTPHPLPEDQLYLDRIYIYSLYYGNDGPQYLKNAIPSRPHQNSEQVRLLFFGPPEEEIVFNGDYQDYERIGFREWPQLYDYLLYAFKDRNSWLIKNSPGRPELIPLHPKCYLEKGKEFMHTYKNRFIDVGYLNEERKRRKSTLQSHEFEHLPEVDYLDEKDLARMLQKQEAPSVILFNSSNRRVGALRGKYPRHKWIGVVDNAERWIEFDGVLPQVTDDRLKRKQDMFANMFNNQVFDSYNDMQYFYLSNKARIDHDRNIDFRTKERLLEVYHQKPNLLMVVFVEAKDIRHIPQALLAESSQLSGRVKLVLLGTEFVDDYETLYIKFNQIDPVINHINAVEQAGRIDFIVYNQEHGERQRQTFIQRRRLKNFENKPYSNMIDIENVARQIKGRYSKAYIICLPEQKEEIQSVFESHSIKNKGIANQGVQYHYIERASTIRPNPSYISQVREKQDSSRKGSPSRQQEIVVEIQSHRTLTAPGNTVTTTHYSNNLSPNDIASYKVRGHNTAHLEEQLDPIDDFELPDTQSRIKPSDLRMELILSDSKVSLSIDQRLKELFPKNKLFTKRVRYFSGINGLPPQDSNVPQLVITDQRNPALNGLGESDGNRFVVVVGDKKGKKGDMRITRAEIPGLLKRLQGEASNQIQGLEDQLGHAQDTDKVKVVYDQGTDSESKRRLLAVSEKDLRVTPVMYKNPSQLKQLVADEESLLLLLMSKEPAELKDLLDKEGKTIVKQNKLKAVVKKKRKRPQQRIDELEIILQEEELENERGETIRGLSDDQVEIYLKMFEHTDEEDRHKIVIGTADWDDDGEEEQDITPLPLPVHDYAEHAELDNITKLNVHSNILPQDANFTGPEMSRLRERLNGEMMVLMLPGNKREEIKEISNKWNFLPQGYTNSMNLDNGIHDRKDNVVIVLVDRTMAQKVPEFKKQYPHAAFILESDSTEQSSEPYWPYLLGQIKKTSELQKLFADLCLQNDKMKFMSSAERAASRFQQKKTSIVDVSNNERFTVGLGNQKNKKVFLFYKNPDNAHVKEGLSDFNNINFIPYKTADDFMNKARTYNTTYTHILIANGPDIPKLEDFVARKKESMYVIRFNPPEDLKDRPSKAKVLFKVSNPDDLENFIAAEFQKMLATPSYYDDGLGQRGKPTKIVEAKGYTRKYEPSAFGTTPRFAGDFVPPKSKESTYSRRYMKSGSRSKINSRLEAVSPKSSRYYQS